MEKSITTPDQYPLTLNTLTNACNQKSSRVPVMSLSPGTVQHTIRSLEENNLVLTEENFKRGVEKYKQRFCNTSFSHLQFDAAEFTIVCLLLLRGPQTPGELRARSGRLHEFADNAAVVLALDGLINRSDSPLVVKLPRTPGRKDAEYTHLFCGPVDIESYQQEIEAAATTDSSSKSASRANMDDLEFRVSQLENEVARLAEQFKRMNGPGI